LSNREVKNDAGDEFGKSALQDRISTNLFLGDADGKWKSDEFGDGFSSGSSGLMNWSFSWSMKGFLGGEFVILRVSSFYYYVLLCVM